MAAFVLPIAAGVPPANHTPQPARIDGSICIGSNTSGCHTSVVPLRMGGFSFTAALDASSGTVYVANDDDGTVSLFAK